MRLQGPSFPLNLKDPNRTLGWNGLGLCRFNYDLISKTANVWKEMTGKKGDTIPVFGIFLLVFICATWGGNMVSIKLSNMGLPPILAATIRSAVADRTRRLGKVKAPIFPDEKSMLILSGRFDALFLANAIIVPQSPASVHQTAVRIASLPRSPQSEQRF